jgi:hypothetical protein
MDFQTQFREWLTTAMSAEIPENVVAFHLNLYHYNGNQDIYFGIDLVGTGSFDAADEDWACDEVWTPEERILYIPVEASSTDWETCLSRMKSLVENYLNTEQSAAEKLKSGAAVGIGFVDGDLELVWQRSAAGGQN